MSDKKSLIVINRWPGRDADANGWDGLLLDYGSLIPHDEFHVIYAVDAVGKGALPNPEKFAYDVIEMESLDDKHNAEEVATLLLDKLRARWPNLDVWRVVCLSEFNMLVGGLLRSKLGVAGLDYETALRCRSKLAMREAIANTVIREPKFARSSSKTCKSLEFPMPFIVKPIIGESSRGVVLIKTEAELDEYLSQAPEEFLVEEYIDAPVYHIDGVVANGENKGLICSRYLNTCLDFNLGQGLGSYIITDAELNNMLCLAAKQIVAALGIDNTIFHLEVFCDGKNVWFLELGARMAGAEVSYLFYDVFDLNLLKVAVNAELGLPLPETFPKNGAEGRSGAWLLLPEPRHFPCTVKAVSSLQDQVPGVVRELIPPEGYVFEKMGHYASLLSGRYVLKAKDDATALACLNEIIARFYLDYEFQGQSHRLTFAKGL